MNSDTKKEQHSTEIKLSVPWGHVAAKTYGSPTGKFILLVHGLMDNLGTFTRLMKYLPMEYYYVSIDLPGHGHSSYFPSWMILDFMDYVYAIFHILEALQWKTCIYLGHSMGAQIGMAFSIIQPHRIEKLISFDGIVPKFARTEETFIASFKELFMLPLTVKNNSRHLYTKEEILHALKNLRLASLNSGAAEALFNRAVTEINGKYKYNRDPRLKRKIFTLLSFEQMIYIVRNISIPLYLFIASHGTRTYYNTEIMKVTESINPESLSQLTYINGNHDFHNNCPENVAPFICKILDNENSSKL